MLCELEGEKRYKQENVYDFRLFWVDLKLYKLIKTMSMHLINLFWY